MTQAELAALLNITPQAVSRWEMAISYPDIAMLPKLSEVLCVTADELLGIRPLSSGREAGEDGGGSVVLNQSQADSIFDYVPGPLAGKGRRILIVDDSDYMRAALEDVLAQQGHTILQARNGQECLDVLRRETVEVCVLDIVMPVMDGITALGKIQLPVHGRCRFPGQRADGRAGRRPEQFPGDQRHAAQMVPGPRGGGGPVRVCRHPVRA